MQEHSAQRGIERPPRTGLQNQVEAIGALDARDGRCAGAEHAHTFGRGLLEPLAQHRRPAGRLLKFGRLHQHVGQHAEGRIVHPAPVLQLPLRKARIVMRRRRKNRIVVGIVSLHHHTAGQISAAGAPAHLRH